jgi:hypothetical protein
VTQAGDNYPRDGSLYIAIANSIDNNYESRNVPAVGTMVFGDDGFMMYWNHVYARPAGTRINFQRMEGNFGKPIGLLPYANSVIYALLDFQIDRLSIGGDGSGLWTTLPIEQKAHDFYGRATVQCNLTPRREMIWATGYGGMKIEQRATILEPNHRYRMMIQMDMFADPTKGRWQAWLDGVQVVDMRGQMALPAGHQFAGCAAFIPCLYSNQLNGLTEVRIPNLILDTQPIQARMTAS